MAPLGVVAAATISVLLMKCSLVVPCLRLRAPHHCADRIHPRQLGRRMWFPQAPLLSTILEREQTRCFFVKLLVYDPMIKVATMRHGFTCISLIGTTWNHQAHYNGNIRLKERPASSGYGAQKRHISDVLSDRSLSTWIRNDLRSLVLRLPLLTRSDLMSSDAWPDRHK